MIAVQTPTKLARPGRKAKAKKVVEDSGDSSDEDITATGLARLFNDAQQGHANTDALLKKFFKLERKGGVRFIHELILFINQILVVFKKEPAVERLIVFLSLAIVEYDEEVQHGEDDENLREVTQMVVTHLSQVTNAKDKAVRYRSCQMLRSILINCMEMGVESFMFDELIDSMLTRTLDKTPAVRIESLVILSYLQEEGPGIGWEDPDNAITMAFMRMSTTDSSPEVRKAALTHIGLSKVNLKALITRTRDIKEAVRIEAYRMLADKCPFKSLTKDNRAEVLSNGLNDRSDGVRQACVSMVTDSWLLKDGDNPVLFLRRFDVLKNEATTALLLQRMFHFKPQTRKFVLTEYKIDDLGPEPAIFWSALCMFYSNGSQDEAERLQFEQELEAICPTLTELTEAILKYVALEKELLADGSDENASTVVFVTNKLLTIAALCDVGDEVGRRLLSQLASDMLVSAATSDVLLPALVDCIAHTHKKTNDRIDVVTGIIRELADDNNYRNTGGLDTSLVVDTETDIADFTADDRQFRSLAICSLFLEKTRRLNINHGEMSALIDNLILPGIQNHNTFIREQAIRSLGLCCVINPEFGRDYLLLLLQVAENDGPRIQLTAVKTLFDLLLVYGPLTLGVSSAHVESDRKREQQADVIRESMNNMSLMENDLEALGDKDTGENESDTEATVDTTIKTYIPILFNLLQSDTAEMRTVAAEGFAKLLHTNHLASHTVFAALMVLYFNPMSSDDQRLRQCLGVFFPEFAFATARPVADKSLAHQAIIERSFLQIMNTLLDAPRRSPLYEVNEYQVGAYLLYLTSPEQLNQNNPNYSSGASLFEAHHALAITIANECLHAAKDGDNYYMKLWSKLLNVIEIEHENQQLVKAMRVIIADLRKECNDSVAQKQLQRSAHQLADYDQTPDDWISRSDIEGLFDNLLKGLDRAFLDGVDEVLATTANTDGSVKRTLRARSVKAPTKTDNSDSEVASDGADESDEESESEADIQEADLDDPESTDEEMA